MIAAVVPGAGRSERMGRPKLTLSVGGMTVIARVVSALRGGGAESVVVVAPPAAEPGAVLLEAEARAAGADVVVPDRGPPDMRASVELGLVRLRKGIAPETVLLVPGDSPGITPDLVSRVIERARAVPGSIVVPEVRGRRGHPVAIPWPLALEIPSLPAGRGVNSLIRAHDDKVVVLACDDAGALADLDTPDDYRHWVERARG